MDHEYGARVRAARCYAEKDLGALAQKLGISKRTLERIENGTRPLTMANARDVARECGVPFLFLWEGFRLYEEAEQRITEPATGQARPRLLAPGGALGHSLADDQTSSEDRPQTSRRGEAGRRRGDAG